MRHLRRLGHCLAAGSVCGASLAPLQLILWPELALSPPRALLALLAWASWGALWFGVVSFLVVEAAALATPSLAARGGFSRGLWRSLSLTAAITVMVVALWNRLEYLHLLTVGRRQALVAGAIVAFLFVFALAVLWGRHGVRRAPRLWATVSSLAMVACMWWVWAATPHPAPAVVAPPAAMFPADRRVLVVSWEGADLTWLLPAMERGDMPFLKTRRDAGAWGQLKTLRPYNRTVLLATLATGCLPAVHGVMGRRVYRLPWLSEHPVALLLAGPWPTPHQLPWRLWERAAAPPPRRATLWEILRRAGLTVGLVGWPGLVHATWVIPPPMAADAMPFSALGADLRASLEPALRAYPVAAPVTRSAFAIAMEEETETVLRLTRVPVNALVVNLDMASRLRPLWTSSEPGSPRDDVLRLAARVLDEQLHQLWTVMGGEDTLLVVVSPYGMAPPSAWKRLWSSAAHRRRWRVSPADSPDGFVLFCGPGVRGGVRLRGARLADVTPIVLYLLDLPIARDMAGRVLLEAVTDEKAATTPLRLISTYLAEPDSRH
jgi:Type I phosphodiesterase / nucleotide pyrophosphatase